MKVILYTLPSCPICKMIKTKLNGKNIPFIEEEFDKIAELLHTDRAPVLEIDEDLDLTKKVIEANVTWLRSPTEMVAWINSQE